MLELVGQGSVIPYVFLKQQGRRYIYKQVLIQIYIAIPGNISQNDCLKTTGDLTIVHLCLLSVHWLFATTSPAQSVHCSDVVGSGIMLTGKWLLQIEWEHSTLTVLMIMLFLVCSYRFSYQYSVFGTNNYFFFFFYYYIFFLQVYIIMCLVLFCLFYFASKRCFSYF